MSELSDARHRTRDHPACAVPPNAVKSETRPPNVRWPGSEDGRATCRRMNDGTATLSVDGREVAKGRIEQTIPVWVSAGQTRSTNRIAIMKSDHTTKRSKSPDVGSADVSRRTVLVGTTALPTAAVAGVMPTTSGRGSRFQLKYRKQPHAK